MRTSLAGGERKSIFRIQAIVLSNDPTDEKIME